MADNRPAARSASAAVALRLAGASISEITETLGYDTEASCRAAIERDLTERARDADPAKRELIRATVAGRIERLLRSVWGKATDPNDPEHLPAVQRATALVDRYAKLYGADAPTEVTVHTPTATELDQWVTAVLANQDQSAHLKEADVVVIPGEVVRDEPT